MEWTRGPVIGRGSSAAVSLATTATGQLFAVKSADIASSTSLQNEQFLISQLCSPFVVKCFGFDVTRERNESVYNIFLEYVAGGTLSDLIRSEGGSLDEGAIKFYTHQMLKGLSYLHRVGFVHCDIKGQNILIGGDDGLKIADFGCAKRAECGGSAFAGTPAYMAPEVARGEDQSFPSDVWALGCTVVEMATGANPWPEMKDPASALYRVAYSDDVPEIPSWFSDAAKDFLAKCFARDSKQRWTAAELLQHPFFSSAAADCGENRKSTKKSPTSVMDQHFWDAVEVSDSSPDPTENPSSSDSPVGRIRGLIGDYVFPLSLEFPEWEEEDWVVVRGEFEMRIEETNRDFEDLIVNEDCFITVSGVGGEATETMSILVEDSLIHSFRDEISNIDFTAFHYILGDSDIDDSVSATVTFERIVIKEFFNSDQLFPAIFFVFTSLSLSLYWATGFILGGFFF
ncbi:hypothetical protein C2S53_017111 [Perilla frutescens var. hirtella]|uniref:Protein kinase domain-containing protein n=1 Tax=Perilla frutescens var. hirtella TaxID=608512 RepID=A0AAD4IWG2_PERFH|nr:hypothetical protein C2S53_017111 [Perilla frutescens var. hirtella]